MSQGCHTIGPRLPQVRASPKNIPPARTVAGTRAWLAGQLHP